MYFQGWGVSLNIATFSVKVVAVVYEVWRVGVFSHLRDIKYFISAKISLPLASVKTCPSGFSSLS